MTADWPRSVADPIMTLHLPRLYGSTPSVFGAPLAETPADLAAADVAFLGVPWQAPVPDSRMGGASANYAGTILTPAQFRVNSIKYGGYLPELDVDLFARFRIVDYGDAEIVREMRQTLANVERAVGEIVDAGCIPVTMGGNAGPSTYAPLRAIAARAGGPVAVVNFDAHHDNWRGDWEDDDPRQPQWGATWARRILTLPGVDPARYRHIGLRGPRNDPGVFERFTELGVPRAQIGTYREIKEARRSGFEPWAETVARQAVGDAAKVWVAVDPDVFTLGASPDFGDEPLGPTSEEVVELVYQIGRAAGRGRFGGLAFMAMPNAAQTLHFICVYVWLYALAGLLAGEE